MGEHYTVDVVERLREKRGVLDNRWPGPTELDTLAADEIERLRNSHDALVAALRKLDALLDFADEPVDSVWTFDDVSAIQEAFKEARTALAAARGEA